jgi:ribonuclease III
MFAHEGDYEKLCLKINYQFRNERLLAQASTTKSGWNNRVPRATIGHQEELAFFGDSLLRMVIDKILMEEFPYYEIGELIRARGLLVRNTNLIEAARRLSLESFIIMDDNQKR